MTIRRSDSPALRLQPPIPARTRPAKKHAGQKARQQELPRKIGETRDEWAVASSLYLSLDKTVLSDCGSSGIEDAGHDAAFLIVQQRLLATVAKIDQTFGV